MLFSPKSTLKKIDSAIKGFTAEQIAIIIIGTANLLLMLLSILYQSLFVNGLMCISFYLIITSVIDWCPLKRIILRIRSKRN